MPRSSKKMKGNQYVKKKRSSAKAFRTTSVPKGAKPSRRPIDPYARGGREEQKYFICRTPPNLSGDTGNSNMKTVGYVYPLLENHAHTDDGGDGDAGEPNPRYIYPGTGRNQRMGEKIFIKSLTFKMNMDFFEVSKTGYGGNSEFRVFIFIDNQPNGAENLEHTDLPKVYDRIDGKFNWGPNPLYNRRFTILKDEIVRPEQKLTAKLADDNFLFETKVKRLVWYIPINKTFSFSVDSQPQHIVDHNIYFGIVASSNGDNAATNRTKCHMGYQGTFLYTDH